MTRSGIYVMAYGNSHDEITADALVKARLSNYFAADATLTVPSSFAAHEVSKIVSPGLKAETTRDSGGRTYYSSLWVTGEVTEVKQPGYRADITFEDGTTETITGNPYYSGVAAVLADRLTQGKRMASLTITRDEPRDPAARMAAERVALGAALLSSRKPDWRNRINLNTLDIKSAHCCPLGQLYGSYARGLEKLFDGDSNAARKHGFIANRGNGQGAYDDESALLQEAWVAEIRKRDR